MTLLKDNNAKDINIALLSLEADIKKLSNNGSFDTSVIDRQLAEINSRIDKINAGGGNNSSAEINDIRTEIENINLKLIGNSVRIENIEQKLSDIFSAENKVTDFNTTTNSGIYYWTTDAANRPTDYGVLLVNKYDASTSIWVNQIAYGTNNKIYFRQNINSGNWTEWKAVAFEGDANKYALTVNGKTYNGSKAVDAGVQTVANGGTGVTTQADINKAFIGNLETDESDVTDGTEFVSSNASDNGFAEPRALNKPYKRKFVKVWNYIKGKISSVLGLTENTIDTLRTNADQGFLCKLYTLASATSDTTSQAYNVILLGKIPDPASTEAPATPSSSWDIDVDFYFVRPQGHKASWCNVKAGYGYSNAWRKYGSIETFGVDSNTNYSKPFNLATLKYNNEYYIGVYHLVDIDGSYAARVKYVNTNGSRNPSTVNNTPLVNMLKVIPYQKTNGTILNSEIKASIADFPNTYAPTVIRNGSLVLSSGNVIVGNSGVAGSRLTIRGGTVNSNSYTDTNPKLEFKNNDGSQNISLTFTDLDAVQAPASLTLNGNQGNEYFIAPCIKANNKMRIPIGAPSSLEDGCIWIER